MYGSVPEVFFFNSSVLVKAELDTDLNVSSWVLYDLSIIPTLLLKSAAWESDIVAGTSIDKLPVLSNE